MSYDIKMNSTWESFLVYKYLTVDWSVGDLKAI